MPGPPEDKDLNTSLITDLSCKHRYCRKFTVGRKDSHSSYGAETKPETAERVSSAFLTGQATNLPHCLDVEWFIIESIS